MSTLIFRVSNSYLDDIISSLQKYLICNRLSTFLKKRFWWEILTIFVYIFFLIIEHAKLR